MLVTDVGYHFDTLVTDIPLSPTCIKGILHSDLSHLTNIIKTWNDIFKFIPF